MYEPCPACGFQFGREPGYFTGAMFASYALAVPFLWSHVGGLEGLGSALTAIDPRLSANWFGWRQLISISMAIGLGLAAAPYEIAAIYSMQSRRTTRLAIGWSFCFQACIGVGVLIFGLSMRVLVPHLPEPDLGTPLLGTSILYAADPTYQIIKEIQIGGEGGWDYLIVDSSAHRVYVSHATKIVVADTETGQIVGEISDTPGVHGIAQIGRAHV